MERVALVVAVVSGLLATSGRAQSDRNTSSSAGQLVTIAGRVITDDAGEPIANARVSIVSLALGAPVVRTDRDGHFLLTAPRGPWTIAAVKTGFAERTTQLAAPVSHPIIIRLRRAAVVSGRVVDQFGDPVLNLPVVIDTAVPTGNRRASVGWAYTDDRGEYRVTRLPAGPISVSVVQPPSHIVFGQPWTSTVTYYPGVSDVRTAQVFTLAPGDERRGIDFVVFVQDPLSEDMAALGAHDTTASVFTTPTTGSLGGRATTPEGHPIGHARIRLIRPGYPLQSRVGTADDDGRFAFEGLAAGTYDLTVWKPGYLPTTSRAVPIDGFESGAQTVFDLADGELRDDLDLHLARWGAVEGHILDDHGDPMQGVRVDVLRIRYERGRRWLVSAAPASLSDDRGHYRVYGLAPGQYVVSATAGAIGTTDLPGYGRSYFPGTANAADAEYVWVASGDVSDIDFALARAHTVRVAGTVVNAAGEPTTAGRLSLVPSRQASAVTSVTVGAEILGDGRFEFPNVEPGQYVIQADQGRKNGWTEGEFGALAVTVGDVDVTDLVVRTSSGSSITGRVSFDDAMNGSTPAPSTVEFSPMPVDRDVAPGTPATADVHGDGTFALAGITGTRRLQVLQAPDGWALKQIVVNGIDITDRPLTFGRADQSLRDVSVVLTNRIGTVIGSIVDDHDRPAAGTTLVLFSIDRERWYPVSRFVQKAVAGRDGAATLTGLPFGTYYVVAVAHVPADGEEAWEDPQYLDSLVPHASSLTVEEGETLTVRLTVLP